MRVQIAKIEPKIIKTRRLLTSVSTFDQFGRLPQHRGALNPHEFQRGDKVGVDTDLEFGGVEFDVVLGDRIVNEYLQRSLPLVGAHQADKFLAESLGQHGR